MSSEPPFGVNLCYDFSVSSFFCQHQKGETVFFLAVNVNEIKAICVIAHVVI